MRLDVTIHQQKDLPKMVEVLRSCGISHIDVTHTNRNVDPLEIARLIKGEVSSSDITMYFSGKFFMDKSIESARAGFRKKFDEAKKAGIKKFLFVSGHPRSGFDSIEMLRVVSDARLTSGVEISCVYNPYFDPGRLREEHDRLREKLSFPSVSGVAFQMGMDVGKLQRGVEMVRSLREDMELSGAIPTPTSATLDRLKLLALYGVFLPNSFLLSVESAKEMVRGMLDAYASYQIDPVVFAPDHRDVKDAISFFSL